MTVLLREKKKNRVSCQHVNKKKYQDVHTDFLEVSVANLSRFGYSGTRMLFFGIKLQCCKTYYICWRHLFILNDFSMIDWHFNTKYIDKKVFFLELGKLFSNEANFVDININISMFNPTIILFVYQCHKQVKRPP